MISLAWLYARSRRSSLRTRTRDRKSTRLNSSHDQISYAVFCLKKKTIELQFSKFWKDEKREQRKRTHEPKVPRSKTKDTSLRTRHSLKRAGPLLDRTARASGSR